MTAVMGSSSQESVAMINLSRKKVKLLGLTAALVFAISCIKQPSPTTKSELLVNTKGRFQQSTSASNLLAQAIHREGSFDFVFVPSDMLKEDAYALITPNMSEEEVKRRVLRLYHGGEMDQFVAGSLRGSSIKRFILNESLTKARHQLHVAGLTYGIRMSGGLAEVYVNQQENGLPIEDDVYYRVAINKNALEGEFPGYRFRHGFNFSLRRQIFDTKDYFLASDLLVAHLKLLNEYN